MFSTYLQLGFHHISDLGAYDHMLFILALCAGYSLKDWKQLAWLITAFTVGHSITLAMSVLNIYVANAAIIEFLIPLTIFLTGIANLIFPHAKGIKWKYALVLFFGCIHGMGFSNFLKSTLMGEESIVLPLLSFNIGLELGQLLILGCILIAVYVVNQLLSKNSRDISLFLNGGVCFMAFQLMMATKFW